jgi:hypothetical protein
MTSGRTKHLILQIIQSFKMLNQLLYNTVNPNNVLRGCIQTFPDWPPGVRTANGTDLCH